jgi:DNA-directed RNA polymerase subunit E'/Rpb7
MKTTIIEKRISLEPKYLHHNILDSLLSKIKEETENECNKLHGHILSINKIVEITNHEISRLDTNNIFQIKFEANTLKPEPDSILEGEVCMIYKDGIFISVMNKQNVLIPTMYLQDYIYDEIQDNYKHKTTIDTIKEGDTIRVKITASQYNKNNFSCFGSIV